MEIPNRGKRSIVSAITSGLQFNILWSIATSVWPGKRAIQYRLASRTPDP